jgi:hypothetical protein
MNEKINIFYKKLSNNINTMHKCRYGKTVFNTMYSLHPKQAQKYCGSLIDPFYNDKEAHEFIEKCLNEVNQKIWINNEENNENSSE